MKQICQRGGAFLALIVLLSSLFSPLALAADANNPEGSFNVVVSPISIGLTTTPGHSVSKDISVKNEGLATEHVKVTVMKFQAYGQDGTPKLLDLQPTDEFAHWVSFSTTHFDAAPNVWTSVRLTISPPASAAFGYYYAVVFSRDTTGQKVQPKQANLLGAVASLVLLDVEAPGAVKQAKVTQFSTASMVSEFLPTSFTVQMHNTGNIHLAPRGNIFITKGGKNVALLEVNLSKGFILPDSYRRFTTQWTDGTPSYKQQVVDGKVVLNKQDKPVTKLSWDNFSLSKLRFGKYDARLVMVYDNGESDVSTEATLSFWVIPWRIIGGVAVVLLLLVAGLWATVLKPVRRRFRSRGGNGRRR